MDDGYAVLDIRPAKESTAANGRVAGAVHVPLFVADDGSDPVTLVKKAVAAGYGGLWMGTELTKLNDGFLAQVAEVLGKDDKFIVGCGEGSLRSLVALDMLCEAGYSQVVWLENGFSATPPGTLPTEGPRDLHLANVGGVSTVFMALAEAIDKAWKAAQPAANAEEGEGARPPPSGAWGMPNV